MKVKHDGFPHFPASTREIDRRKKHKGVGVNDAPYVVAPKVDGKVLMCPFYKVWRNMLDRAYSAHWKERRPTLIGVTVCDEWRRFMAFRGWMEKQQWAGMALDKDILVPGNKEYGPATCAFVRKETNALVKISSTGAYAGVDEHMGRWRAQRSGVYLGHFDTREQAATACRAARAKALAEAALVEKDPRVPPALLKLASEQLGGGKC